MRYRAIGEGWYEFEGVIVETTGVVKADRIEVRWLDDGTVWSYTPDKFNGVDLKYQFVPVESQIVLSMLKLYEV